MFPMPFGPMWGFPPINPLAEPPSATDGPDLYIQKILARHGIAPASQYQDAFQKAGVTWQKDEKSSFFNKALKWAGLIFAGALGAVVLKKAVFPAKKSVGRAEGPKPTEAKPPSTAPSGKTDTPEVTPAE